MSIRFYTDILWTLDHLQLNVCQAIADIQLPLLDRVIKNWSDYVKQNHGKQLNDTLIRT